jgi:hypothetical protein
MTKHLISFFCFSAAVFAQSYQLQPIAEGAKGLPSNYAAVIDSQGYRVVGPNGPWCEIWFRKSIPAGAKSSDPSITLPIAQGTLLGVLRFPNGGEDRRGQTVKAGLYTMRYSNFPVDGAHQGVAPQRDFALLTPVANDPDPAALPDFNQLVSMSKTSGTGHPVVFSLEVPAGSTFPEITQEGEHDTVLNVKVGDLPIAIIVAGKYQG